MTSYPLILSFEIKPLFNVNFYYCFCYHLTSFLSLTLLLLLSFFADNNSAFRFVISIVIAVIIITILIVTFIIGIRVVIKIRINISIFKTVCYFD